MSEFATTSCGLSLESALSPVVAACCKKISRDSWLESYAITLSIGNRAHNAERVARAVAPDAINPMVFECGLAKYLAATVVTQAGSHVVNQCASNIATGSADLISDRISIV